MNEIRRMLRWLIVLTLLLLAFNVAACVVFAWFVWPQ